MAWGKRIIEWVLYALALRLALESLYCMYFASLYAELRVAYLGFGIVWGVAAFALFASGRALTNNNNEN